MSTRHTIYGLMAALVFALLCAGAANTMAGGAYDTGAGQAYASSASTDIMPKGTIYRIALGCGPAVCPALCDARDDQPDFSLFLCLYSDLPVLAPWNGSAQL